MGSDDEYHFDQRYVGKPIDDGEQIEMLESVLNSAQGAEAAISLEHDKNKMFLNIGPAWRAEIKGDVAAWVASWMRDHNLV